MFPEALIDPLASPTYVLEGRLVTMAAANIIADGALYIRNGILEAVQPVAEPAPEGFETAPRIRTGDTLFPGLIELHNHLCYNAMPLWDVPETYTNNSQWKRHPDYQRLITKPSQVLGGTPGLVEALVRYSEGRCLLGGVTTSQGITLSTAPGIRSFYRGVVRNVEDTEDPQLPDAGTRIGNPENNPETYLNRLRTHTCYLQHLSEGVDDTARGWFQNLQFASGEWAVTDALCGIHSTALHEDDFRLLADRGASIVWSPLSNYLLYGGTLNLNAAKAAGIRMGLGSDWAPSGSKNLLGELKVAWLANQAQGNPFANKELVAMVTSQPAQILKWDAALGTLEPGKRADVIAVNGRTGDPYRQLIEARETSLTLVVINGIPRAGQPRLMLPFGPGTEEITVGRSRRLLNLAHPEAHPLVEALTLTEATERLRQAMRDLPRLAEDLDTLAATGAQFAGSADAAGEVWRVVLDFEEEEGTAEAFGASLLAPFVQPMELEPITVADDRMYVRRLSASRNLPSFISAGLPALHGWE